MELSNSLALEVYPKILVAVSGLLALFFKFRKELSATKRKEELKLELEILELSEKTGLNTSSLKTSHEDRLGKMTSQGNSHQSSFISGTAFFVGFGLWSLDLYQNSESFNGWIIMTIFLSLMGISMMLNINRREDQKAKEVFLQINLLDKGNFQIVVIFTLLFGILTAILLTKIEGFSFWQFLTGLLFFSGLVGLARSIKVNRV